MLTVCYNVNSSDERNEHSKAEHKKDGRGIDFGRNINSRTMYNIIFLK